MNIQTSFRKVNGFTDSLLDEANPFCSTTTKRPTSSDPNAADSSGPAAYSRELFASTGKTTTQKAPPQNATTRTAALPPATKVSTKHTPVDPKELAECIRKEFPELSPQGVTLLVAQSALETRHWNSCWNFNLGNKKFSPKAGGEYQHLRNTWEGIKRQEILDVDGTKRLETPDEVLARIQRSSKNAGLEHLIYIDSSADHQNQVGEAKVSIIFDPPHPQSMFRSYRTMQDGARDWLSTVRNCVKSPKALEALNSGNAKEFAFALHSAGYYTAERNKYARDLESVQKRYTGTLNPAQG